MKKTKKIASIILGVIIAILAFMTTNVNAQEVVEYAKGELPVVAYKGANHFLPHTRSGYLLFCAQGGASLKATITRGELDSYPEGTTTNYFTTPHSSASAPWYGTKTSAYYTRGATVDNATNQDLMYILAKNVRLNMSEYTDIEKILKKIGDIAFGDIDGGGDLVFDPDEEGDDNVVYTGKENFYGQISVWDSDFNKGIKYGSTQLSRESKSYKEFYASIHKSGKNLYEEGVKDNTNYKNVKVAVNQEDDYYIAGPFNISYPQGAHNNKQFSWIEQITLKGYTPKDKVAGFSQSWDTSEITDVKYITKAGKNIIGYDGNGNAQNVPLSGEDFYVKFKLPKDSKVQRIGMDIKLKYIESCYGDVYAIDGVKINWNWRQTTFSSWYHETSWNPETGESSGHTDTERGYKMQRFSSNEPLQMLIGIGEEGAAAWINYENAYLELGINLPDNPDHPDIPDHPDNPDTPDTPDTPGIDITMHIKGRVFLDQPTGKENTINNAYDKRTEEDKKEELAGIDVWLYDSNNNLIGVTLTNSEGIYSFEKLDAQKKYYVRFVYNGQLYTNVKYMENGENNSKATEEAQGHSKNRSTFNQKFAEVGSYPSNYETTDYATGAKIYNKVYRQEEVTDIFKEVARQMVLHKGNEIAAYNAVAGNDAEKRSKVQFVRDSRISAYTVTQYPRYNYFVIDTTARVLEAKKYEAIYQEQEYVNLGIKSRATVDLALYKDVLSATLEINGKTEKYTYDARKDTTGNGFAIGISQDDYQSEIRKTYTNTKTFTNDKQTREVENDSYHLETRAEEIVNGQASSNDGSIKQGISGNYQVVENYTNMQDKSTADRLKVFVTYKLSIRNESGTTAAITEIVDYYDTNYIVSEAYVGDKNGNKTGNVKVSETSIYQAMGNNSYKSNRNAYKTMYLIPEVEKRLHNDDKEQYIYITLQLVGPTNDAGELLSSKLLNGQNLAVLNLAEINGYKTYANQVGEETPGLIDIDSNPGNLNISEIAALTDENIKNYPNIKEMYEDDTSRAPTYVFQKYQSRTIEGTVFEDATGKDSNTVYTNEERKGDGKLGSGDVKIAGAVVELIEIKNGQMTVRGTTTTDSNGWYGFVGFLPGNYTIRYTYGEDDNTALMKTSQNYTGLNDKSYNGQDFQSTAYGAVNKGSNTYQTDTNLKNRYVMHQHNKNAEEANVEVQDKTVIDHSNNTYWYTENNGLSDARDDEYRKSQVIWYATNEYGTELVNHKAEVFKSFESDFTTNPGLEDITKEQHLALIKELERRTYRFAYTAEMPVEVEYAKTAVTGNYINGQDYVHKITGVDFGVVERPKAKLEIEKNVSHIKVTATDGTVLFDNKQGTSNTNLSWNIKKDRYTEVPPIQVIMDDELISGATLQITYSFKVTNKGEKDSGSKTSAKSIIDYISNNLTFTKEDGENNLWDVVSKESIQKDSNSTLINNADGSSSLKKIDLTTKTTILKATAQNPLTKALAPGESTQEVNLILKKILSAESTTDDLTYKNIAEIVEIKNDVGRYDHTSIPGNQDPDGDPKEDDSYRSEIITIIPPFGAKPTYYIIGLIATTILAGGIYIIKKKVIDKN